MGSWRKMGAFLGLVPEEEAPLDYDATYDAYPEPYGDADLRPDYEDSRAPARERARARADWAAPSGPGRVAAMPANEPATHGALAMQLEPAPRAAMPGTGTASRPHTVKLTGFAEARIIGERFRDGASVILDMTELTDADARRVVDFAAGLAFALHGSIDKVTTRVFMLLPPDSDLSPADRRSYAGRFAAR